MAHFEPKKAPKHPKMAKIPEKPSDTLVEDMLTDHLEDVAASGGAKYFEIFSIYWNFFQNKLIYIGSPLWKYFFEIFIFFS